MMSDREREDIIALYQREIASLTDKLAAIRTQAQATLINHSQELAQVRLANAKTMHALDCSTQLIEALIAWMPEGLILSEQVKNAKGAWTHAMRELHK